MTETTKSEVEIAESTAEGRMEMAAAEASLDAIALLNRALRASGMSQKELADAVGVGGSRVSQVLTGDGNLRITTLARYLRAAGFILRLDAVPAEIGGVELPRTRTRTRSSRREKRRSTWKGDSFVSCWSSPVLSSEGVGNAVTFHLNDDSGSAVVFGERTKVPTESVPSGVLEWVIEKHFDIPVRQTVKKINWNTSKSYVVGDLNFGRKAYVDN